MMPVKDKTKKVISTVPRTVASIIIAALWPEEDLTGSLVLGFLVLFLELVVLAIFPPIFFIISRGTAETYMI